MDRRIFFTTLLAGTFYNSLTIARAAAPKDLADLDMIDTAAEISSGRVSMFEVTKAAMDRIDALNPHINALVTKTYDYGVRQIAQNPTGPLAGVPYMLKDLNPLVGVRTTSGSRLFSNHTSSRQSPYTDNILSSGVIILGKTNTPEFGLMPTTEPIANGATRNPYNLDYSCGGSSGGAAAAVASRMVAAAQASDGGGSIRFPAAACNLFGLKPSRGRFGDQGYDDSVVNLSIRHAISRTVRDSAFMLALTENGPGATLPPVGYIEGPTNMKRKFALSLNAGNVSPDYDTQRAVQKIGRRLEGLGHEVEEVEITMHDDPLFQDLFAGLWAQGAKRLLDVAERVTGVPATQSGLLEFSTLKMIEFYVDKPIISDTRIKEILGDLENQMQTFYQSYDGWISPISPKPSPRLGYFTEGLEQSLEKGVEEKAIMQMLFDRLAEFTAYTPINNALGCPAMSVPVGFNRSGIPIGVQIAANTGQEALLLDIAYQLESDMPWIAAKPTISA